MIPLVHAIRDPALRAIVTNSTPLLYAGGADPELDRPAHIRAASSINWVGDRIALIQDDTNFLALMNPQTLQIEALTLPAGEGGLRQFDDLRGNKKFKWDLEASLTVPTDRGDVFLAFGSGSSDRREQILIYKSFGSQTPFLVRATRLYAQLRRHTEFSGSELNIEGALFFDGWIRLFNRGNGAPLDGLLPVNATCDLLWADLANYLEEPEAIAPPTLHNIQRYDLGNLDGLNLSFTDATVIQNTIIFVAAAEDSPDATSDGEVSGSSIGILAATPRWTELLTTNGERFPGKVEGVCGMRTESDRLYLVVDSDDPTRPSELCEVQLEGPWFTAI